MSQPIGFFSLKQDMQLGQLPAPHKASGLPITIKVSTRVSSSVPACPTVESFYSSTQVCVYPFLCESMWIISLRLSS